MTESDNPFWVSGVFRRNRFNSEPEAKKSRPAARRDSSGFERYPKNFETVRRAEPPPTPRADIRDTDRREIRDRDERRAAPMPERRAAPMPERPAGGRAPMPGMSHTSRSPRGTGHATHTGHAGWKNDGGMSAPKGDIRSEWMDV